MTKKLTEVEAYIIEQSLEVASLISTHCVAMEEALPDVPDLQANITDLVTSSAFATICVLRSQHMDKSKRCKYYNAILKSLSNTFDEELHNE